MAHQSDRTPANRGPHAAQHWFEADAMLVDRPQFDPGLWEGRGDRC
jgi:hypothetical protein